jgi:integrase
MGSLTVTKIKLKYTHRKTNKVGKVFWYFRRGEDQPIRLPGLPGSTPFMEAYGQALDDTPKAMPKRGLRVQPGSMAALVHAWYASGDFKQLRSSTKVTYRGIMERFLDVHGEKPVARLERKHLTKIIGDMSDRPAAANNLLARLKQICRYALENDWIKVDPTIGVRKIRYRVEGFYTWTESDAEKFVAFHKPGTMAHTAFMLLSHTGVRRSDVVKLGRGNVRGDTLVLTQQKNGVTVIIPLSRPLAETLAGITDRMVFLQSSHGKPFTAAGFGNWFHDRCEEAGLPGNTAHGLRKLIATRLAEAGCGENTISAILGWANNKQASLYTRAANKERMARDGIEKIA